jgi:hypothetical protein
MAHLDDQYNKMVILQPANNPVVADSIAPEPKLFVLKSFAKIAGFSAFAIRFRKNATISR